MENNYLKKISHITKKFLIILPCFFVTGLLSACQKNILSSHTLPPAQAAILPSPSASNVADIKAFIRQQLNTQQIKISAHPFADNSWLIIQHMPIRTIQQHAILGRSNEIPRKFQLLKAGKHCYIESSDTKVRINLANAKCQYDK